MTLSMAVMPMSNFPSIRLVSWNTDEGVGVSSTSSPSRAKNPLSWAAQIGQLNPPGNTITWRVSSAAPGRGTPRRARARSRIVNALIARTLPRRTLPRLTPGGTRSYDQRHIPEENAMAIRVLELHHHGIRVGATQEDADKAMRFYNEVLGLSHDPGRPYIPTIPGYWVDVGGRAQIHLMGVNGQSKFARSEEHTSELQSLAYLVCRLLLEKKKKTRTSMR